MELTLKRLLEDAEFKKSRGKGYDPAQVDEFLERASAMANKVEAQLTKALEDAKAATGPSPEEIEAEVERRVSERATPAASEEEHAEEMRRTLVMAQRTADAAITEAREEAEKIVATATEQSEAMLADATARSESLNSETEARAASATQDLEQEMAAQRRDARARLAAEIAELEGVRESLRSDVNLLERHVEEQRSQLGSTLAELQQVLDDPAGFRLAPAPALIDPELPDFSDLSAPEPEPADGDHADGDEADGDQADGKGPSDEAADAPADAGPGASADLPDASTETDPETTPGDAPLPDEPVEEGVPQPLSFAEVDHAAPGLDDGGDAGPPTAPVSAIELGLEAPLRRGTPEVDTDTDDAFLAELRKAMADDEPLGPRDDDGPPLDPKMFDDSDERPGRRFGRRR